MPTDQSQSADERDSLTQCLDHQRAIVLRKTDGLSRAQLAEIHPPSTLTLGGLLNHLALVEDSWLQERFRGLPEQPPWAGHDWDADPNFDFRSAADLEPEELRERYRAACARSRETTAAAELDQLSAVLRQGAPFSLRWVLLHLIEETARHAGHADLIREAIDGTVGD